MDTLEARRDIGLEQSYIERARELVPMLREAGDAIERGREVTPEIVAAMKDRGIFRMLLPRSLGGAELDPLTYTEVLYTLAQGDGSTAWCLGTEFRLLDDRAVSARGDRARGIRRPRRHPRLGSGPARSRPHGRRRRRLSRHRALGVRDRQPARQMARLPHAAVRAGRQPAQIAERAPAGAHDGLPQIRGADHRQLAGPRACAAPAATATR